MEHFAIRVLDLFGNGAGSNIIHLDLTITGSADGIAVETVPTTMI